MATSVDGFKARFKEFDCEESSRIQVFLDDALLYCDATKFGTRADQAQYYLAAHLMKLSDLAASGASGPLVSEKVGEVSKSYAQASSESDAQLGMTAYGSEYLRIRRTILVTPFVTC